MRLAQNELVRVYFKKIDPNLKDTNWSGSVTGIWFAVPVSEAVKDALSNVLQSANRREEDNNGSRLFFFSSSGDEKQKTILVKQALHRVGFQRFDDVFGGRFPAGGGLKAETKKQFKERLDRLFGVDAERFGFCPETEAA